MPAARKKAVTEANKNSKKVDIVSAAEANKMFAFYCQVRDSGGITEVARKFKRARTTIYRVKRQFNWDDRYKKIQDATTKKIDKQIIKSEISNMDMARTVKRLTVKRFLEKAKDGRIDANVRDVLAAIEFEEEDMERAKIIDHHHTNSWDRDIFFKNKNSCA